MKIVKLILFTAFALGLCNQLWSMEESNESKQEKLARLFHFKTLGLKEDASLEDIKIQFSKMAFILHPDRWNFNRALLMQHCYTQQAIREQFNGIAQAYEALTSNSREDYKNSFPALLEHDQPFTPKEMLETYMINATEEQTQNINENWQKYIEDLRQLGYREFVGYKKFLGFSYAKEYSIMPITSQSSVEPPTRVEENSPATVPIQHYETEYLLRTKIAFRCAKVALGAVSIGSLAALGYLAYYQPSFQDIKEVISNYAHPVIHSLKNSYIKVQN